MADIEATGGPLWQVGVGITKLANSLVNLATRDCDLAGHVTFSAMSWERREHGSNAMLRALGAASVAMIDKAFGAGHCQDAADWHRDRGLLPSHMED